MMVTCGITFKDAEGKIEKRRRQFTASAKEFNKNQLRSRKERESNKGKIANGHLESVPWNGTQKGNIKLYIILLWIA